ncbi:Transcriptional activator [Komagataella phaffii CBS 7435]|uniref:Transcriptional activator of genes involved in nitrogen catabolite repression n=2 Tax=Komagataella phaffii TaxID=460519 RepID=C4R8G1_KOMPG|nr:Transcriptional activator of genes involved in nitrogen catabolite repression [Komagataella phaffii GS115]AOA64587.1 GQ67_05001T0 [Komagataella phaffii]CAH2450713.1 Transcriptional activator [Komagataella phaffii CBS 7435]AOA70233.1 GQ68_04982T0 [Komagataella phaffii GS115]CAY71886.1 Transcriptional activator of genes involved in nitrogen catabolite repression [Komagataella phaffii GS115]CCA40513.1 Transcriptional activator [Komagataella phaffii CBS 7435]
MKGHELPNIHLDTKVQSNKDIGLSVINDDSNTERELWRMYSKAKTSLPYKSRMENLTWRLMTIKLKNQANNKNNNNSIGPNTFSQANDATMMDDLPLTAQVAGRVGLDSKSLSKKRPAEFSPLVPTQDPGNTTRIPTVDLQQRHRVVSKLSASLKSQGSQNPDKSQIHNNAQSFVDNMMMVDETNQSDQSISGTTPWEENGIPFERFDVSSSYDFDGGLNFVSESLPESHLHKGLSSQEFSVPYGLPQSSLPPSISHNSSAVNLDQMNMFSDTSFDISQQPQGQSIHRNNQSNQHIHRMNGNGTPISSHMSQFTDMYSSPGSTLGSTTGSTAQTPSMDAKDSMTYFDSYFNSIGGIGSIGPSNRPSSSHQNQFKRTAGARDSAELSRSIPQNTISIPNPTMAMAHSFGANENTHIEPFQLMNKELTGSVKLESQYKEAEGFSSVNSSGSGIRRPLSATKKKPTSSRKPKDDGMKLKETNNGIPISCSNCKTQTTPLWRRDPSGKPLCNACGLFLKLHGSVRPLSLKTDVIKKRQRDKNNETKVNGTGKPKPSAKSIGDDQNPPPIPLVKETKDTFSGFDYATNSSANSVGGSTNPKSSGKGPDGQGSWEWLTMAL